MGWFAVLMPIIAAFLFGRSDHPMLFWCSMGIAAVVFWSFGVMHNYAMERASARRDRIVVNMGLEGRTTEEIADVGDTPIRISAGDAKAAPDALAALNMGATLAGAALLIWAVVARGR